MTNPFATLINTGNPLYDVRRFLRAARRLDTLRHVAQVNAAARRLAQRLFPGMALAPMDLACTAHDLAAVAPLREIVAVAQAWGVPLSAADRAVPQMVHGPVAAAVLARRLGVTDQDVHACVR